MTVQLEKYGTNMACLEGLPEESLLYLKTLLKKQHMLVRYVLKHGSWFELVLAGP